MMNIKNVIELVHKYESSTNINKRKEILNKLLENFKKCESNVNAHYAKLLKEERDINEK